MLKIKSVHEIIEEISPYYKKTKAPESEQKLVYDSPAEGLEPIYFFILDLMNDFGLKPEKLIDNFSSSVGSGHFSDFGMKKSTMQQQGSKLLADINNVLRTVLNLIYDLREFRIRLQAYDDLNDSSKKNVAILSLKQIWLDKVDMQKGNSSVKAMALSQAGFVTLLDAFLAAKDVKDIEKLDLNERVKRIIIPRLHEFDSWLSQSEQELRKRYEIEKTYLKSQINSLKLYSRWAKPYLKAASELESADFGKDPALVKVFNTLLLELTLLGKRQLNIKDISIEGDFPSSFAKESFLRKIKRNYNSCVLIEFNFRGIPQKLQQGFAYGGRAEITFKAYSLNDEELQMLYQKLDDSDLESSLNLITGITDDSLGQLKDDIDYFLGDEKEEKQKSKDTSNPFMALFGKYESKPQKSTSKEEKIESVQKDNWYEKEFFRKKSAETAKETLISLFDIYKKAHGMASFP